jgi:hypothetical protein
VNIPSDEGLLKFIRIKYGLIKILGSHATEAICQQPLSDLSILSLLAHAIGAYSRSIVWRVNGCAVLLSSPGDTAFARDK